MSLQVRARLLVGYEQVQGFGLVLVGRQLYALVVSRRACPASSATVTRSVPPRTSVVTNVWRRGWAETPSPSRWASVAMAVMMSPAPRAERRPPRWLRNSAAPCAPGQSPRSASQSASTARSAGWRGTSQIFSPLPRMRRVPLRAEILNVVDVQADGLGEMSGAGVERDQGEGLVARGGALLGRAQEPYRRPPAQGAWRGLGEIGAGGVRGAQTAAGVEVVDRGQGADTQRNPRLSARLGKTTTK